MKFSDGGIKTLRSEKDPSINAQLLIRGCFVDQVMAGVYSFLPLGLRVLKKIENIIREEMVAAGGQELLMPSLQPKENWEKTGRWETEDNLYRFTSYYTKTELALGPTHEEIIMPLAKRYIESYRDLPLYLFQIQNKFRDERRAKAGLLRGREFLMKDLYSFHTDEADLDIYYEKMTKVYQKVFARCGIGEKTYITYASGGSFSKFSHEFQTVSESGEDTIYLCEKCKVAINKEISHLQKTCPGCGGKKFKEIRAIEVGNIFKNKTKFTAPFGVKYLDKSGKEQMTVTGCYGIGLGRLMGAIVEVCNDERGIIWPETVAPFDIHLVSLDGKNKEAGIVYEKLVSSGYDVLWDDRDETAGVKLSDADLLGIPLRVLVSKKTIAENKIEIKARGKQKTELVKLDILLKRK